MGGYKVNNCKEGTENGASQREKRLCKNSHQSMAQQACSSTKVCSSTQAQHNKRTVQQKHSAGCPFTQKCSYWESFLLAQGKFDVFNLLTECSIRGKLALDFLTTVEDGGMVAPTQFTSDLG